MKVLFLLDYIRLDHYNDKGQWVYLQTQNGSTFKKLIETTTPLVRDRSRKDYVFDYVYNQVPQPIYNNYGKVIKYEDVKITEAKPYMEELRERIEALNPDIIIPTGKLGIKMLLNVTKLGSVRGVPQKIEIKDISTWVLPTYSIEYTNVNKNSERQVLADMEILNRYLEQGEETFKPKEVNYEFVDTIERVREIFNYEIKNDNNDGVDITAWDLETNSLRPDMEGSKALVASLSWKNGQGVTIPLYKADFQWENGQQDIDEILGLMKEWLANKEDIKVLHNGRFDIKFLMGTEGFKNFESNEDTIVGWYLAVTQETADSLRLSNLAYEATDMGGYDKPLEDFKVWFLTKLIRYFSDQIKEIQKENKKIAKQEYNIKATEYKKWIEEKIDFNKDLGEQFTSLKLIPEVITENIENEDSFKEITEESEEYKNLSESGKKYTINTATNLINKYREHTKVINDIDGGNFNYDWFPIELMHPYASGDTDVCRRVYCEVINKLEKQDRPKAIRLLREDYPRLTRTLARLEHNGFHLDMDYMLKNDEAYINEMDKTQDRMREHWAVKEFEEARYNLYEAGLEEFETKKPADRDKELAAYRTKFKDGGWKFSPSSGEHKGEILYNILGIKLPYDKQYIKEKPFNSNTKEEELTWKDYKTDKESLKKAITLISNEEVKDLLELLQYYATLQTKRNSFTKKLPKIANPVNNILHPGYNIVGTETSRLSSSNPNIQQVPSHTSDVNKFDYTHPIKRSFTSRFKDGIILQFDYSALEMRIMGVYTKDEKMLEAFLDGEDFHKATASIVYGKPISDVTAEERQSTKAVNFGIAYGKSSASLADDLGISKQEGEDIFNKYYSTKPKVKESIDYVQGFVQEYGYVETLSGHRRFLADAQSADKRKRSEALRQSYNTVIQGSGAYLTNMALTYIDDFIETRNMKSKLVATVHDSIVLDCPQEEVKTMAKVVKIIMDNLPFDFLKVEHNGEIIQYPIDSDAEIGFNYNDAVGYDEKEIDTFNSLQGYIKYGLDLAKVKDYYESKKLTEEQYQQAKEQVESQKELYQNI